MGPMGNLAVSLGSLPLLAVEIGETVHSLGARSAGPFVPIDCAAIPLEMLEDELFGHVTGAFTDATSDRQGAFERVRC